MKELLNKPEIGDANPYEYILDMYKGDEAFREWMNAPFVIGDLALATDAHCMVAFDKSLITEHIEFTGADPAKVLEIFPQEYNQDLIINVSELEELLRNSPTAEDFDEIGEDIKCNACDGGGEVEFEFYHNGRTYETEADCPICVGFGLSEKTKKVPNGKKVFDYEKYVGIGTSHFDLRYIHKLFQVAQILNEKEIKLLYQINPTLASLFGIGNTKIIVMPVRKADELVFSLG